MCAGAGITRACPKKPWRSRVLHYSLRAIGPHGPEPNTPGAGSVRGIVRFPGTPAPLHAAVYDVSSLASTVVNRRQSFAKAYTAVHYPAT